MRPLPCFLHHAEQFGDCTTADFFVFTKGSEDEGLEGLINGLVILDVGTHWLACIPTDSRDAETVVDYSVYFIQGVAVKRFYSDNELGFVKAAKELKWRHDSSKPHDHQSNGLIENRVKDVKDGAWTLLYQAGMPPYC